MKNPKTNPFSVLMNTISHHYVGLIAVILVSTGCYLFISSGSIPTSLEKLIYIIVSFLFGTKVNRPTSPKVDP